MIPGCVWKVVCDVASMLALAAPVPAEPPAAPPGEPQAALTAEAPRIEPVAIEPLPSEISAEIAAAGGRIFYGDSKSDQSHIEVVLMGSQVTPRVLASLADPLAKLPRLRRLTLMSNAIRDDDLESLAALQQLEDLQLNCHLTGAGVSHLAGLQNLTGLGFVCSEQLTDTALIQIRKLPRLKQLRLFSTPRVTDTGLKLLRNHPALEDLTLKSTGVTPQGLDALKELPALKRLSIAGPPSDPFTRERIQRLQAELPGCTVTN